PRIYAATEPIRPDEMQKPALFDIYLRTQTCIGRVREDHSIRRIGYEKVESNLFRSPFQEPLSHQFYHLYSKIFCTIAAKAAAGKAGEAGGTANVLEHICSGQS